MTNVDSQECWYISSEKYFTAAVTNVEYVFGKMLFKVVAEVCHPSEMWLFSRDLCERRDQGIWIPMLPRTHWDLETGSENW